MKRFFLPAILGLLFAGTLLFSGHGTDSDKAGKKPGNRPNDWFFRQRAFPYEEINYEARTTAWQQAMEKRARVASRNIGWILEGPVNVGGRISALASPAGDALTIYAGAASGGVFRTVNGAAGWEAVLDDALSLSIGDIAIAPSDPSILYVGTGEANGGGGSLAYDGFGIYRSGDGGESWEHIGLENSGSIGRLAVHPQDPQTVYVAAMGRLFSNNSERGIFRTTDGGQEWEQVLFISDSTGGIDLVIDPVNPDTLYAAMWERVRRPDRRSYGGPTGGIYRSFDGGDNWTLLSQGLPANSDNTGRIGIDISASSSNTLYAIYADKTGYFDGVYKTTDHGNSWTRTQDNSLSSVYASYGWWFGRISIDPADPDIAYVIGLDLYKTGDGGNSWYNTGGSAVHVDQHDLIAHPSNPDYVILGNDGGIYLSTNQGGSWTNLKNLPITQFYTCEADYQHPERLYGGTQDNGTNRTMTGSLDDWQHIYWGDGFYVRVDPVDNSYVYAEYQYGQFARSTNGGSSFYTAMNGIDGSDRMNWNTPFTLDPVNPDILYYGSHRIYRTFNRAVSWSALSPDLTNGPGGGNLSYGTITTIDVAPSNTDYIYAGTDDGNVWVSPDGGTSWNSISDELPQRWVTRVAADPHDELTAYVCLSGYRYDSYQPHVYRTIDAGLSWQDISGDLPEAPANDIIVDPDLDSVLYLGTDFGVFVSRSLGANWQMLGNNLPNVPVLDLTLHNPSRKLVAATYGRSMYTFALSQLVDIESHGEDSPSHLILYPNPSSGICNLYDAQKVTGVQVFNSSGSLVRTFTNPNGSHVLKINVSDQANGTYILRWAGKDGTAGTLNLFKSGRN